MSRVRFVDWRTMMVNTEDFDAINHLSGYHWILSLILYGIIATNQLLQNLESGARTTRFRNPCITLRELESRRWPKRQTAANLVYFQGI